MKRIATIIITSLLGAAAYSQEVFTLRDAIDYSLKNHGSTTIYNNQLEIANQQAKEALSAYLPQVNATINFDDNLKRQTTVIPGAAFGTTEDKKKYSSATSSTQMPLSRLNKPFTTRLYYMVSGPELLQKKSRN